MRAAIGGVLSTRASRIQQEKEINTNNNNITSKNSTTRNNPKTNANGNNPTIHSRQARPSQRPPLQSRDHNAMMRGSQKGATPLTAKSGNTNMPSYEKSTNSSRPLMPTLSASAKGSNRPPLTPRVAGSAPTIASTPTSRQGRTKSITPGPSKDDISTPVSAFLNNNVTPRSGSRKIRVDSTNTTPTGTPNSTPLLASSNESFRGQDTTSTPGLGTSGVDKDTTKRTTVSFNTGSSDVGGYVRSPGTAQADSKFFFASDAKTTQPPTRPPLPSKSSSTFFYANGESIPPPPPSSGTSAVGSSLGDEKSHPKFFHVNGTPDLQLSPSPHFAPPRASSVVSSSSRMTLTRAATSSPNVSSPPQRPMSPSKLSQQANVAPLRNAPTIQSTILSRPHAGGRGSSASNSTVTRRSSIESRPRISSHGRSISMGSTSSPPTRKSSGSSPVEAIPPSTPLNLITSGLVSSPDRTPDPPSSTDEIASDHLQSPIKAGQSIEHLNEMAANARRERKVLDLEITNSSLAAINRTLEREMRKQTAELRRYRRLSRSGRLSIASTSLRNSTGTLSIVDGGLDGLALSDMSEEEEEDDDGFSSETSDSMDDGSMSPAAMAESDLRHRQKDEKRLQLDLSKHQQLLIDSQKMNQSLKRCLGWTEALISEGKKALEYKVRVDIELGGRVLAPDELESPEDDEDNEGMSDIGARMLREARQKAAINAAVPTESWEGEGRDDRDSGIDVDGSHRERLAGSFD
jgi:hypothetical protein